MGENFDFKTYSKNMRLNLCGKDIIDNEGNLNHRYFLVKKGTYWSPEEDEYLINSFESISIIILFNILFNKLFIFKRLDNGKNYRVIHLN